jgi:hypothetical protein
MLERLNSAGHSNLAAPTLPGSTPATTRSASRASPGPTRTGPRIPPHTGRSFSDIRVETARLAGNSTATGRGWCASRGGRRATASLGEPDPRSETARPPAISPSDPTSVDGSSDPLDPTPPPNRRSLRPRRPDVPSPAGEHRIRPGTAGRRDLPTGVHRPRRLSHKVVPSERLYGPGWVQPVDNRITPAHPGSEEHPAGNLSQDRVSETVPDAARLSPVDVQDPPTGRARRDSHAPGLVNVRTEPFRANVFHTNPQAFTGSYPQRWTSPGSEPHRCGSTLGKSMWTDTERHKAVHRLWTAVDFLLKVLGTTSR